MSDTQDRAVLGELALYMSRWGNASVTITRTELWTVQLRPASAITLTSTRTELHKAVWDVLAQARDCYPET